MLARGVIVNRQIVDCYHWITYMPSRSFAYCVGVWRQDRARRERGYELRSRKTIETLRFFAAAASTDMQLALGAFRVKLVRPFRQSSCQRDVVLKIRLANDYCGTIALFDALNSAILSHGKRQTHCEVGTQSFRSAVFCTTAGPPKTSAEAHGSGQLSGHFCLSSRDYLRP